MRDLIKFKGEVLKDLIKKVGMTYDDFAEAIEVHPATVINWARRNKMPSTRNLTMLANFFDVSEDVFLESRDIMTRENAEKIAEETYIIFTAFQTAGFSQEQAMQLTLASMRRNETF